MSAVLVSAATPPADLRDLVAKAGFAIIDHGLDSIPHVDFAPVAVVLIDVSEKTEAAIAQTRRWRAELGDEFVPIVWLLPESGISRMTQALDAGADAVLTRPLDPAVLLAQLRRAAQTRATMSRVTARANESRLLGEHLRKAQDQIDRESSAARRLRLGFLQRTFPIVGSVRFSVVHHARGRSGGDFYEATSIARDRVVFQIGDVIGPAMAGGLLGNFAAHFASVAAARSPSPSAGEVLTEVNRELIRLELEDSPLVAMLVGMLDTNTGVLELARAGLPAPFYLPATGTPEIWAIPGPFLGTADTNYSSHLATLHSGDRLLIGSDGIRPDGNPESNGDDRLLEVCMRFRDRKGQAFADAVAIELLAEVRHEDDFTLMLVEG